jgi:torulene dioxygenase
VADQTSLHKDLKGPLSAAHAQYCPATGDVFNYNLHFGRHTTYRFFRTSFKTGKTEILAKVSGAAIKPAYIHSFFMTENYVILCIFPTTIIGAGGARILWEQNIADAWTFEKDVPARWLVIDKRGRGHVATFLSPPFFAFHSANSWEERGGSDGTTDLICQVTTFPDAEIVKKFYYENVISTGRNVQVWDDEHPWNASFVRYRLAGVPDAGTLAPMAKDADLPKAVPDFEIMNKGVGELPTYNPNFKTKPTRYMYNVTFQGLVSFLQHPFFFFFPPMSRDLCD